MYSWTESTLVVEKASLHSEELGGGKTSLSILLELSEDPQSSSNTRKRQEFQIALGVEEKDVLSFVRLLGRKVYLSQEREVDSLEREQLLEENDKLRAALIRSEEKIKYLNDSLHRFVGESR